MSDNQPTYRLSKVAKEFNQADKGKKLAEAMKRMDSKD